MTEISTNPIKTFSGGVFSKWLATLLLIFAGALGARAQLVANFTSDITTGCVPFGVNFTDASTGGPTSWFWDFGNGNTSTAQNPFALYTVAGSYTVKLKVSNGTQTDSVTKIITAAAKPVVSFVASDSSTSCAPKTVTFTPTVTTPGPGPLTYGWDFGNGASSANTIPTYTFLTAGSYQVILTVTNGAGCTGFQSKSNYINTVPSPTATFSWAQQFNCTKSIASFSNLSPAQSGVTYKWRFNDGSNLPSGDSFTNASTFVRSFPTSGPYTVQLIATNGICQDTDTKVVQDPIDGTVANFTAPTSACANVPINFTNTSTPNPLPANASVLWDFGDGSGTSTDVDPIYTYTNPGTYTVTLTTRSPGCTSTINKNIIIQGFPSPSFTTSATASCTAPLPVSFTNTTTPPLTGITWQWDFGCGTPACTSTAANPNYTFTANGTYQVTLTATNAAGCAATSAPVAITIGSATMNVAVTGNACGGSRLVFDPTITGAPAGTPTVTWNFGDATPTATSTDTIGHVYSAPGVYTLTVNAIQAGCSATFTQQVTVGTRVPSAFTLNPTTPCLDSPILFSANTAGPAGTTYAWNIQGGTNFTVRNSKDTTFRFGPGAAVSPPALQVQLITNNNGCRDTTRVPNALTVSGPRAQFTNSFNCATKLTQNFTSTSLRASSYEWDFGDGTPVVTTANPTHTYATYGRYKVTLTAFDGPNSTGCKTRATKTIPIFNTDSSFRITKKTICPGDSTTFIVNNNSGIQSVKWQFSSTPSDTSGTVPPTFIRRFYPNVGTYSITLTVTDSIGCTESLTKIDSVTVRGITANFTATPLTPCPGDTVTFTDQSLVAAGSSIVTRYWDFGNGNTSNTNSPSPKTTYASAQPGGYNVFLRVIDNLGCRDSITKLSYINPIKPQAIISVTGARTRCVGENIPFTNTSKNATGYLWIFGDGTTSTDSIPTKSYAASGTYPVRLVAYGTNCNDTSAPLGLSINILSNPAFFTLPPTDTFAGCPPLTVRPAPSAPAGSIFNWDFGDGRTSTFSTGVRVTYTIPGTYRIKLTVTTPTGCTDTFTRTVTIGGPRAKLNYTPIGGCVPLTVNFTMKSFSTTRVIYDFGTGVADSTMLDTFNINYTYNTVGTYLPQLLLLSSTGCAVVVKGNADSTKFIPDTIKVGTVIANFTSSAVNDSVCAGTGVQFTDATTSTAGPATGWSWDFGDGTTDTARNPIKVFTNATNATITRSVRLIVFTSNCSDTITKLLNIKPTPSITVTPNGSTTICTGTSVQLQATATGLAALNYVWTPAAGLSNPSISNPIASPSTITTYQVVATNNFGCSDTDTVQVDVRSKPDVISSNDTTICSGNSVQLATTGAIAYSWSVLPGGNPISTLDNPSIANPIATPTATTTYVVVGSFGSGTCSDTDSVTITVNSTPVLTVSPNVTICSGRPTQLIASGAQIYSWAPTAGLNNAAIANPIANPTTTTTYTVVGTNLGGCADTETVTVTVNTSPVINAGPDQGLCPGQTYTFPSVGVADSYSWTPTTDLSNPTSDAPTVSRAATPGSVTYTVVGVNLNGCSDTDTVVVTTYPDITVTTSNDTTICSGASITLSASGANTYRWSPNLWLSSVTSATPIATPLDTTTYYVVGTDLNGCKDTDSVVVTVLPSPNLVVGNNFSLCSGTTAQLNASNTNPASVGPVSYNWSPGTGLSNSTIANPTVSNLSTSVIYTIVATDAANGCTDTAYQIITPVQSPNVVASVSIPSICYGQATNLSASGASSYQWSPNVGLTCTNCATPNAVPNATTTYTVVGSTNGCSDTADVTVTVNPLPVVSVTPDSSVICAGQNVQLNASGGAPFYAWTPSTRLSCTSCPDPIATPTTTTIYRVTARTSFGCTATAQSVIIVNPKANVVAAVDDSTICEGDSTILRASGALTYTWYPAAGLSCTNCTDPVASPVISTTYRVIGSGVALCDDTAYVYVRVIPKPDLTVTPSAATICVGNSTTLTASSSATGIFNWKPTAGLSCTNCPSPVASPTQTTIYTASFTALATGCTARQDVEVKVNALPAVTAGPDRVICAGVPTELKVFGASTYVWSPATGLSCTTCNNPKATIYDSTTYVITGTDIYGCSNTDTLTLTIIPRDTLTVTPDTTICAGSSIRLQATGGTSYLWSPVTSISNPRIANPTVFPSETTTYRVAIANADCYVDTLAVTVRVVPLPVVNAGVDANVVPGASVTLNGSVAADVIRYFWTPVDFLSCNDCLTPVATPRSTTTYTLHGLTAYGCEGTDSVTIFTRCGSSQVFVPNTFTPNGDGQNDRFYPRGNGLGNIKSFRIYSRWGELVYEAQNIKLNDEVIGWDGSFKGQPLKPDTYVWILEGTCETGDPLTMNGDISIIR